MEINPLVAAIQAKQAVERKPTAGAQVAEPQKTFEPSAPAKPRDKVDAGTKLNVSRDFDERSNRLVVVFGLMHERLIGRRGIQKIRQVHPFGIAHQTLGDPHRARRFRGDDSGPFAGPFHQFFMRHKFKHHTKLQRFLGLDHAP